MYTNPEIKYKIGDQVETTVEFKTALEDHNKKAKYKAATYLKGKITKIELEDSDPEFEIYETLVLVTLDTYAHRRLNQNWLQAAQ